MKSDRIELLAKVIAWRTLSMTCGVAISYSFTGEIKQSIGITLVVGPTLMLVQWGFELFWDKYVRERLRNAISREQGGTGWLLRLGRDSRAVSVDEHKSRSDS